MDKLTKILNSVDRIVENSNNDIITEITNISDILDVDKKTAIVLHFVNKDSSWNPQTLHMLEDVSDKLPVEEQRLGLNPEKQKQTKDFYLLNYLDSRWGKITLEHIKNYSKMNFFNVWLRKITSEIMQDNVLLALLPEDKSNYIWDKNFPKNAGVEDAGTTLTGLVHPKISEWLTNLIREVKPGYRN
jgi:flagellar biosynthesis/type III secretory pathway chaperone|tara:strand:+ start:267 stop:827 length:561 start_codon:yes stop_codon:yes gene_type:complete